MKAILPIPRLIAIIPNRMSEYWFRFSLWLTAASISKLLIKNKKKTSKRKRKIMKIAKKNRKEMKIKKIFKVDFNISKFI